ncbi:MAG: aminoacyl-histidine dipeptidase, partial [Alistipes sp.]|nr:aminoacyl-histidine dipeptidase [Candidatus Minthomonas equi]
NKDVPHDWLNDSVKPRIEGDWVWATGTTLGADNGMGVATAMSILQSKDIPHGPVEALFTIDEETGMTGAKALKPGLLHGDILLNLDSEAEGELYIGCAGGLDTSVEFKYSTELLPKDYQTFILAVKGLRGGHSGMEIHEGRANANKLLARLILPLMRNCGARLISIEGGTLRNAIPRECEAVIAIPADKVRKASRTVKDITSEMTVEYRPIDAGLNVIFEKTKAQRRAIDAAIAFNAIQAIYVCPCNVDRMSLEIPGLVETSNNLAVVKSEKGKITVKTLMRGSIDSAKHDLRDKIRAVFELAGASRIAFTGGYSGWMPNSNSEILRLMKETYRKMYGQEPKVMAIHAGLECGILSGAYPHWDMISFGPTLMSPHSPDERCYIPSVEKFWNFLLEVIRNIPEK